MSELQLERDAPLEQHPIGKIIRPMTPAELRELAIDIKEHGLYEPIDLYEGMILEGNSRYIGCMTENVEPRFREFEGSREDAIAYVRSKNLVRRHLGKEEKAEKIKAIDLLLTNPERTDRSIAKETGIGNSSVSRLRDTLFSNVSGNDTLESGTGDDHAEQPAKVVTPRVPRHEDSGRVARGVKPGSSRKGKQKLSVPKVPPEVKPTITVSERDAFVNVVAARVKAEPATACPDIILSMWGVTEYIRQRLPQEKRESLLRRCADMFGAKIEIIGWIL